MPAAYMRSSTSTVSGKKSMPSRGLLVTTVDKHGGLAELDDDGAVGERGQAARLERHDLAVGA